MKLLNKTKLSKEKIGIWFSKCRNSPHVVAIRKLQRNLSNINVVYRYIGRQYLFYRSPSDYLRDLLPASCCENSNSEPSKLVDLFSCKLHQTGCEVVFNQISSGLWKLILPSFLTMLLAACLSLATQFYVMASPYFTSDEQTEEQNHDMLVGK